MGVHASLAVISQSTQRAACGDHALWLWLVTGSLDMSKRGEPDKSAEPAPGAEECLFSAPEVPPPLWLVRLPPFAHAEKARTGLMCSGEAERC